MIDLALRQALRSECRHRVGAVLTIGSRVLAASPNRRRNNPAVTFTHATFHAEEATLRRAPRTNGGHLFVARVDASGLPRMAKPCLRCQYAILQAGITRVIYTVDPHDVQNIDLVRINLIPRNNRGFAAVMSKLNGALF
ncbi:deaminase [Streptomyces sp. NPDC002306]